MSEYLAHISDDGREQGVLEHLEGTARLAEEFAQPFGAGELARQTGLAHDLGKYTGGFQRRLRGGPPVDHSTAGAVELQRAGNLYGAFCAAGHHAGLPDGGSPRDEEGPTLLGRLRRGAPEDCAAFRRELELPRVPVPRLAGFEGAFFTRMLFSCLVDADFLDTETFMAGHPLPRGGGEPLPALCRRLRDYTAGWLQAPRGELNRRRSDILRRCILAGQEGAPGLYSLTVPTGGGKTVSSLAFALEHALARGKRRVIYVIPYTSIIEQTADTFREILGEDSVLEHHATVDPDRVADEALRERLRLAAENWDAPVVVTTGVQFFESLFASRPSKCRKLHRLAESVIIFDEAQMLPLPYLLPCLRAVRVLVEGYGVTAVLCTATQPSFEKFFPGLPVREICPDASELSTAFRRVTLRQAGELTLPELASLMEEPHTAALAILGSRAGAVELYRLLPEEGRFCLTTLMTPVHRRRALAEIRERLRRGLPCRVAATSLVEAGVDLDFPAVYREAAGLDSVLQAAGRCNREGKRPAEESPVTVFTLPGRIPDELAQGRNFFLETARETADAASPEAVRRYFDKLHAFRGDELDKKHILEAFEKGIRGCGMPFAQVAELFQIIPSTTRQIFVPLPGSADEEERKKEEKALAALKAALPAGHCSRAELRRAGQYMVSVYPHHLRQLLESGAALPAPGEMAVLADLSRYDAAVGLSLPDGGGQGLFF